MCSSAQEGRPLSLELGRVEGGVHPMLWVPAPKWNSGPFNLLG